MIRTSELATHKLYHNGPRQEWLRWPMYFLLSKSITFIVFPVYIWTILFSRLEWSLPSRLKFITLGFRLFSITVLFFWTFLNGDKESSVIFTARIRSMWEGNDFSRVCLSVCLGCPHMITCLNLFTWGPRLPGPVKICLLGDLPPVPPPPRPVGTRADGLQLKGLHVFLMLLEMP